ncbi:ABC transporter ATP-binding protein [Vineibacter terrae]|uniref:ABC transporter ATP-binding protein n=1 Tax=Vineibacter terrae TaxID=2586908 RepID=UPI002E31C745|nr:ABC transporter ATP-binding protein [Vineibacter terrae]HEX2891537.1 ABC transporter ATP-binding protein [Vineibacter terrae]
MTALEVRDLHLPIGGQEILKGVNVTVAADGIVCILGANGVGKTTLMRTIGGVYRGAQGTVRVDGVDITNLPSHEIVRAGVSQAPEGRHIFGSMTVEENLRIGAISRPPGELRESIDRVCGLFPILRERLKQKGGSLSGGEQQMLCIGRALMARPKLLMLDEPSLGLAPMVVRTIFGLLQDIRRSGTAILLVEQNASAALRIADYAYVMEGGRVSFEGAPDALKADERIVAAYLGGQSQRHRAPDDDARA